MGIFNEDYQKKTKKIKRDEKYQEVRETKNGKYCGLD